MDLVSDFDQHDAVGGLEHCPSGLQVRASQVRQPGVTDLVAVMRKLLLLAWPLLRTGQPFSPTYHVHPASA